MPDIIDNTAKPAPALSATSDAPTMTIERAPEIDLAVAPKEPPVDNGEGSTQSDATDDKSGEADDGPADKQTDGEEGDKTSPQQRAAFARERNRRQAAEQRANALESKVDQLIEVVSKLTPKEEAREDPRPIRSAFDDPDAYERALEGWAGRRAAETARAEATAAAQKQQQDRQRESLIAAYQDRQQAFAAEHPDFDEVFTEELPISPFMTEAIVTAEDGPAIAYWLGQNPEEAERISKLGPVAAVREIGKIEAALSRPTRRAKPAPITPLRSRNDSGSDAEEDMNTYGARRIAELRAARVNH